MSRRAKDQRLSAPLMFAFREAHRKRDARSVKDERDSEGTRVIATRRVWRAATDEKRLRDELQRDLDALMNTTSFESSEDLTGLDLVRRSIVNYGIPDIVNRTIDENRVANIVDEIETAVVTYEPRLIRKTIRVMRDMSLDPASLTIRYFVTGEMRCDPVAIPVEFVADLETDSGRLSVAER